MIEALCHFLKWLSFKMSGVVCLFVCFFWERLTITKRYKSTHGFALLFFCSHSLNNQTAGQHLSSLDPPRVLWAGWCGAGSSAQPTARASFALMEFSHNLLGALLAGVPTEPPKEADFSLPNFWDLSHLGSKKEGVLKVERQPRFCDYSGWNTYSTLTAL